MSLFLEARAVSYRRDGRTLVSNVDLAVERGSCTIVVGPNGAGKSTLMRLLCGELAPTEGEVRLHGALIGSLPAWRLAHARAVMPQASDLGFPFTCFEVANLGVEGIGRGLGHEDKRRIVHGALARADVAHLARRNYQSLSGGERQRVHFARVLAQLEAGSSDEPRQILFLDEPIASLDLKHQLAVLEEARRLARSGLAVVAILHDLQLAASVGDELVLMKDGAVVASGPADNVLNAALLTDVFGVRLKADLWPAYPWDIATG
ncbi:heme ABC transporter ATP-binding protein [Microvirga sp. 2MCAF38]|uniref:heme ABC transporter ATP-binding protein n=1 Tax=Microvirga sp. 2MCAF38 TaxID=3232989 RepID=UPI003F9A9965